MNEIGSTRRRRIKRTLLVLVALALAVALTPVGAVEDDDSEATNNAASQQIDINKATEAELTEIPGVGTVIARRIVEFREKQGPFRRVEDLLKIKGIGEKSFQKIRPHVKVDKID